jgi:delta24-sterol reductase
MEHHARLVNSVSAQVRKFHDSGVPFRIYHGSTNSTRTVVRDLTTSVDISAMNNILSVDTERRIASVQPNVPMDALIKATLAHGLIPPVVPEFPGITVGGGFSGSAGESSSFKYGFLDSTIDKVEVVLGNGTIREVGPNGDEEEKELFWALAGTLGTLGVLTRLDIRLLEAKPFVKLTYQPVWSFSQAKNMIESAMMVEAGNDFVDGILYSPTKGAIVSGKMVSETGGGQITQYNRSTDEWCFIHTEEMIEGHNTKSYMEKRTTSPMVDYVPLADYLFRYDRGAFWMGKLGCQHFCLPFTKTTRTLLDSLFHTREMYTVREHLKPFRG